MQPVHHLTSCHIRQINLFAFFLFIYLKQTVRHISEDHKHHSFSLLLFCKLKKIKKKKIKQNGETTWGI